MDKFDQFSWKYKKENHRKGPPTFHAFLNSASKTNITVQRLSNVLLLYLDPETRPDQALKVEFKVLSVECASAELANMNEIFETAGERKTILKQAYTHTHC